jgi:uncharacterized protein
LRVHRKAPSRLDEPVSMEPRLTLVTLGVADVAASRMFYEKLGFKATPDSNPHVTFFYAGGIALALFGRAALAEDAHVKNSVVGFSGISLAHNVRNEAEVDAVLTQAVAAGARLLKPGQKVFWGGYSGYFSDPDGHLWEVAHNPFWPFDDKGCVVLPGSAA